MSWKLEPCVIAKTADHYKESSYRAFENISSDPNYYAAPSWFSRGWWDSSEWSWVYTNDTDMPVKVKSLTFVACAGHSNGKKFGGGYNSGPTQGPVTGGGCTFASDIYVVDASGNALGNQTGESTVTVPSISDFNCYYNGYGQVDASSYYTSFGAVDHYGPGTSYHTDRNGVSRCREKRTINYKDAPVIPVGGKMFVTIRPISWATSGWSETLLVIQGYGDYFESVLEPVDESYIWVCQKKAGDASPKWYKEKKSFLRTSKGWEEM